jgi:endonuclease-8
MPEGDTLFRTATVLREVLLGRVVTAARSRPGGPQLARVAGSQVERVDSVGKHLLIGFDDGLSLHTHLGMNGSWHRYRPGERWRRSPARAVCVIETATAVAVCFDAPVAELIETRALALHPALARLGPDLIEPEPDVAAALARSADPSRRTLTVGEALLDQRLMAGLGNVYRSEVLFLERVDPFLTLGETAPSVLERLVATGARLLRANRDGPRRTTTGRDRDGERLWVYRRTGRPCRRCGTHVRSAVLGSLPRRLWWCPGCQPTGAGGRTPGSVAPDGAALGADDGAAEDVEARGSASSPSSRRT